MKNKTHYIPIIIIVLLLGLAITSLLFVNDTSNDNNDNDIVLNNNNSDQQSSNTSNKYTQEELEMIYSRQVSVLFYSADYNSDMEVPKVSVLDTDITDDDTLNVLKMQIKDFGEEYMILKRGSYESSEFTTNYYLVTFDEQEVWIIYEQPDGSYSIPHNLTYEEIINSKGE